MSLRAGTRLGPYEILSALGAGGMGEVYRARDIKLNRDVAIKVLLPAVANDANRLARFSREAQVLASLNHPNIAQIHGLEEANGITALVMELVEGEDLCLEELWPNYPGSNRATNRRRATGNPGTSAERCLWYLWNPLEPLEPGSGG